MKTSSEGIALIKSFESCKLAAYKDAAGVWTIGWGTTSAAGIIPVTAGVTITQTQADDFFMRTLAQYENAVSKALKRVPTQSQFDAMVSLCYNIGPTAFAGSSVVRYFNAGDIDAASRAFALWDKAGGKVLPGLVRRRAAEAALFSKGTGGPRAADSAAVPSLPPDVEPPPPGPPGAAGQGILAAIVRLFMAIFGKKG